MISLLQVEGLVSWLLNNPEVGWVVVVLYLMWEIRGPKGKINELTKMLRNIVTVVRALARTHDEVDTQKVDEYLTSDGHEPGDFINESGNPMSDSELVDGLMSDKDEKDPNVESD